MLHENEGNTVTLDDVASLVLASAAAARAYAPDACAGVRRLLGAGVRVGAQTLIEEQLSIRTEVIRREDAGGGR
ncbi:hypothetical protein NHG22_34850 [Streptomyces sp. ATE26]|uniref:hypothetical protein n=1 Tax=Streptomyces sp. ATE26 TaxID=2954237 RepID=UPI002482B0EF|nr:hypothetical protein [Streptomyces sp. ATE26]MDI1458949.1 hypothetical protein [Streptomyces sp. ATE26]